MGEWGAALDPETPLGFGHLHYPVDPTARALTPEEASEYTAEEDIRAS